MNDDEQFTQSGFGEVADAFFRTIADDGRSGAALSVWCEGIPVVELSSGIADDRTGREFTRDTLAVAFSSTKGMASVLIALLIEEGVMPSLDTPVVELWPEFGAHGKDRVTIGDALAHRAGLSAPRRDLTIEETLDDLLIADAIAAQDPLWRPGEDHQYHAITHGAITAKLVNLATGQSIGACFADRVAGPLDADSWIGLPESEEARVARLIDDTQDEAPPQGEPDVLYWVDRAVDLGAGLTLQMFDEPRLHRAGLAGAGGITTASGLARMWSATVTPTRGVRLINDQSVAALRTVRSQGRSHFLQPPPYQSWGAGVMTPSDWEPYLSPSSFGHDGAGGQVAFADLDAKIGFAYLTNRLGDYERGQSITAALSRALG